MNEITNDKIHKFFDLDKTHPLIKICRKAVLLFVDGASREYAQDLFDNSKAQNVFFSV